MLKLHILPSTFLAMDEQEKAFVVASIKAKIKADKDEQQRIRNKSRKKGR